MTLKHRIALISLILLFATSCLSPSVDAPPSAPTPVTVSQTSPPTPVTVPQTSPPPTVPSDAMPGAPGLGDSLYPGFGNGGFDVQHYTLDLTVEDLEIDNLEGLVGIEARATQALSSFNLDLIGLDIESVIVNGEPAEFTRSGQEMTVTPAQPLEAGEGFVIQVTYSGVPGEIDSASGDGLVGWIAYEGGTLVLSQPDGAANFFPVNDHPLDKATYTFRITVPEPFEVAANGALEETIDQGDMTTFVWEMRAPMASYLATVNIGEFDIETGQSPNGIPIRNYFTSGLGKAYRQPFARQGEMLDFFSQIYGAYPFEVYGSIMLDTEMETALEAQTLSIYGTDLLDWEDTTPEHVVAHELAHHWFGDSVSLADWSDIWLNEGFATYAEALWVEHTEGGEALDEWVTDIYEYVAEAGDEFIPPGEPTPDDLFNEGVYCRGALTLHALRLEVGDEAFFEILATYFARYKDSSVRTDDFFIVAGEVSGQDLGAFFEAWLYGETLPAIPALGLGAE